MKERKQEIEVKKKKEASKKERKKEGEKERNKEKRKERKKTISTQIIINESCAKLILSHCG